MRNEDDEIQILGSAETPLKKDSGKNRRVWIAAWTAVFILACVCLFFFLPSQQASVADQQQPETSSLAAQEGLETEQSEPGIHISSDLVNDVPLTIYSLHQLQADLQINLPDTADHSIVLAIPAADVRKDNQEIVGDFVVQGKELSFGKRKAGYCSIIQGKIEIGISTDDQKKEECISQQDSFFRQYSLIFNGNTQKNILKGKSFRRALVVHEGKTCIVISKQRESLYDFTEALADLGFQDALYLVGGNSLGFYRDKTGSLHFIGKTEKENYPNRNYIVFRK